MRSAKESVVIQALDYHEEGVDPRWADTEQAPRYAPGGEKKKQGAERRLQAVPYATDGCHLPQGREGSARGRESRGT